MESLITIVCLYVMFAGATAAIFTCYLEDTLGQRIALVGVCFGSLSLAEYTYKHEPHVGLVLLSISGALWAISTGLKLYRVKHGNH